MFANLQYFHYLCTVFTQAAMPRAPRHTTPTGIYHVMMRGINHQVIFEDTEDYEYFMACMERFGISYDDEGMPAGQNCTYYAYCLMSNHFHLLIREREEKVWQTLKRIADAYVYYYNRKYQRSGHLFKDRFRSEPVDTIHQFTALLSFIHRKPIEVGLAKYPGDYPYSSWGEYSEAIFPQARLCHVEAVLQRISFEKLNKLVSQPPTADIRIMDIDDEKTLHRLSDAQVKELLANYSGATNTSQFQQLDRSRQTQVIRLLREQGASIRQLERLTGLSRGLIFRMK